MDRTAAVVCSRAAAADCALPFAHAGGKGKGGARAMFLPPARSRAPSGEDGGKTITEKIKDRKAAGGAEAWDEFKARVAKQQQELHALEHHDVMLSAAHREVLDKEREARLRREPAPEERKKRKERDESDSSSDDSDDSGSDAERKRRRSLIAALEPQVVRTCHLTLTVPSRPVGSVAGRREHKKSKKEKKHKHKHRKSEKEKKHRHKHRSHRRSHGSDSDGDGEGSKSAKASAPVPLSQFLAAQSDSEHD